MKASRDWEAPMKKGNDDTYGPRDLRTHKLLAWARHMGVTAAVDERSSFWTLSLCGAPLSVHPDGQSVMRAIAALHGQVLADAKAKLLELRSVRGADM
jgi:hypothetical protein